MSAATAAAIVGAAAAAKGTADASKASKQANAQNQQATQVSQEFAEAQQEQARADLFNLFPQAQQAQQQGFQGALDAFKTTIPAQTQAFTQGNQQAQGTISAGLPQIQRALLGLPTDFTAFNPQSVQPQGLDALAALQLPSNEFDYQDPEAAANEEALKNQTDAEIYSLYRELLGRDPDPSGLNYYRDMATGSNGLVSPKGLSEVRASIMSGSSYQQRLAEERAQAQASQQNTGLNF